MPPENPSPDWGFNPVYDLMSSLPDPSESTRQEAVLQSVSGLDGSTAKNQPSHPCVVGQEHVVVPDNGGEEHEGLSLGNLNRLWDALGVQRGYSKPSLPHGVYQERSAPSLAPYEAYTAAQKQDKDAYVSDGAINYPPSSRTVRWADDDGGALAETQQDSLQSGEQLTKNQRKRRNKKARKDAENQEMAENIQKMKRSKNASTNADSKKVQKVHKKSASLIEAPYDSPTKGVKARDRPSNQTKSTASQQSSQHLQKTLNVAEVPEYQSDGALRPPQVVSPDKALTPTKPRRGSVQRAASDMPVTATQSAPVSFLRLTQESPQEPLPTKWPVANPGAELQKALAEPSAVPMLQDVIQKSQEATANKAENNKVTASKTSVSPLPPSASIKVSDSPVPSASVALSPSTKIRGRHQLLPLHDMSSNERNWNLLLKLIQYFPEDNKHLLSPLNLTFNEPVENGLHVFIDASNILIGFYESLKRARGIPEGARVMRVYPYFAALALVLERRRPVCKRVLVGSEPWVSVYDDARKTGYEINILEKVFKVRELTERQKKFATRDAARASGFSSTGNGSESGGTSGASVGSAAEPLPRKRWLEQGVDETLHAKMGESLTDVDVVENARPTMILATGDFQAAEYTSGFGKWVERALKHGWNVEIAAWSASISMEYFKMQNGTKWEGRLRVIQLDDFAEELFPSVD